MLIAFNAPACEAGRLDRTLAAAITAGLDGVVWSFPTPGPDEPIALAAAIGRATTGAGLATPAVEWDWQLPVRAGEALDDEVRHLTECTALAGSDQMVVIPGSYPEAMSDRSAAEEFGTTVTRAAEISAENGIRLTLGLGRTLTRNRARTRAKSCSSFLADVLRALDTRAVRVRWDMFRPYLEAERLDQTWDNIRPWFSYLELGDLRRDASGWRPVPIGAGELPVALSLAYVGGTGYAGWISHDPGRGESDSPENLAETLRAYRLFISERLGRPNDTGR